MFIPDVINTLLMGLIFIVIVVTVVRPIMLNLVHTQVDGDDIQKMVNQEVNKHLIRHFQDAAAQRTAEIRFQKLLLDVPKKPERAQAEEPEEEEDELEQVVEAPIEVAATEEATPEVATETEAELAPASEATEEAAASDADAKASEEADVSSASEEEEMADGEIEIREGESLAEIKERLKREQKQAKKPAIPPELLNNANSYEDKVGVVRMVVQADHSRVASLVRSMIQNELSKNVK